MHLKKKWQYARKKKKKLVQKADLNITQPWLLMARQLQVLRGLDEETNKQSEAGNRMCVSEGVYVLGGTHYSVCWQVLRRVSVCS